jgi:hypothetical protein
MNESVKFLKFYELRNSNFIEILKKNKKINLTTEYSHVYDWVD